MIWCPFIILNQTEIEIWYHTLHVYYIYVTTLLVGETISVSRSNLSGREECMWFECEYDDIRYFANK